MKFRMKPVIIEAEQYKLGMEDGFENRYINHDYPDRTFTVRVSEKDTPVKVPYIETLIGRCLIAKDDWIITGSQGERRSCKPDIFNESYEAVEGE